MLVKLQRNFSTQKTHTICDISNEINNFKIYFNKYYKDTKIVNFRNFSILERRVGYRVALILFSLYEEWNINFYISFSDFLRVVTGNDVKSITLKYNNIEDFFKNTKTFQHNKGSKLYNRFIKEIDKYTNFMPIHFGEAIYCYRNNITNRPLCKNCNKNELKYNSYTLGYRDFCSHDCQVAYRNKCKDKGYLDISDDKVREILKSVDINVRNLNDVKVASIALNIDNFIKKHNMEKNHKLLFSEKIYLFINNITDNDYDRCPICNKDKKFKSQIKGYTKTCCNMRCVAVYKDGPDVILTKSEYGNTVGGSSMESGYLYVLKYENYYKIGIAKNVKRRIKSLSKQFSKPLKLMFSHYLDASLGATERYLHSLYKEVNYIFYQGDGYTEWFNLCENDLNFIKGYLNEKNN